MNNLMNIARGGLSAAQLGIGVTGNNMANAFTEGYNRRTIVFGEAGGRANSYGFLGYGVQVNDINRAYDSFITNQLHAEAKGYAALHGRAEQLGQIDKLFGDTDNNLGTTLDDLFKGFEGISKDSSDLAARQNVLSTLKSLSSQFRTSSNTLNNLEKNTDDKIKRSVDEVNTIARQLADLNKEISKITAREGKPPADLLDRRDVLLSEINQHIGVKVRPNTDGSVDVTFGNGMTLVSGDKANSLKLTASAANPAQSTVSYIDAAGNEVALDESKLTKGVLGGLFKFRNEDLAESRNQLNQLALKMADRFNEANRAGFDLDGNPGENLFDFDIAKAVNNRNNTGSAALALSYDSMKDIKAQDYTMTFSGGNWQVTRTADGVSVPATVNPDGSLSFDGITVGVTGTAAEGDSFQLNPTRGIADTLSVSIDKAEQIAAADKPGEVGNNENIKKMIGIKDEKLIGNATLNDAYASLVSSVGAANKNLDGELKTSGAIVKDLVNQQQSVSGVDVNEEFVNLQMYQQFYQANAQVLQTANTLFDTLLRTVG
ncbi:flagellar hook-associated protein FlgK [Biostraticola tofi]|uniref:Flagellar hook-associated protein 1 n=1 Tax=Biostraticola tofi TaxID=466109 RepID=A0A4R3YUT7_9GAMM|nr:flagellar hook-associated protein FlgK [Biostraticola tofi]TCV95548.1 flagellar hook-associated protein 1 FlgK [Biostraticola tofi]